MAAVSAGFALVSFYPIPADKPGVPNYGPIALTLVVSASFLSGGFIGRRGFTTEFASTLWRPVVIAYACMLFLYAISDASFKEGAAIVAFVSVGIVASVFVSLAMLRWFPSKGLNDAA